MTGAVSVLNAVISEPANSLMKRLVAGVLILNLVVAGIISFSLHRSKLNYNDRAIITTQNISQVLDENMYGAFSKIDMALQGLCYEAERQLASGAVQEESFSSFIVSTHSRLPELAALRATNAAGNAIYGPKAVPAKTTSLAHRDYFTYLRNTPHAGLVISKPLIGGISGKWMIILARRINRPDGTFAGLAYAGVTLDYLTRSFSKINIGRQGIISLVDSDFSLVARHPEFKKVGSEAGHKVSSPQFQSLIRAGKTSGTYNANSSVDSIHRVFSFRTLALSPPLYVIVGLSTAEHLANWRTEVLVMSLFMLVFLVITVVSSWLFHREWLRKRASEHAVMLGEQRFRLFVENANDIVFTLSAEGLFTYVSPNWKGAFGYEFAETIGKPFAPFVHPDDIATCFAFLQRVLETKEKQNNFEYRVRHKNGTLIWYSANGSLFRDPENNEVSFLGIGRDISDRKRAEQEKLVLERQFLQAQKLESLGIMAGGIAHDFNNLLQSIIGNMELAERKVASDPELQTYIADAISSGKAATQLTNLMLTYVGKGHVIKRELGLNEIVRGNADMLRTAVSAAVSLDMKLAPELPVIMADEAQVQQVIMNLITNATESIERQPGLVRLATGVQNCDQDFLNASLLDEKPAPGLYVFLEVSDNGCGMDTETVKRLFDPFFTTKFTGRGLGMSAVMGIIRSHGGAMFVESAPGRGTTFRVLFPAAESAWQRDIEGAAVDRAVEDAARKMPLSGLVLVVDDDKSVLRTCVKMVQRYGLTVITACDGVDAVNKFREHADEIVVVLLDLTMPNMDGIAAMSKIYDIKADTRVILASGFTEEDFNERMTVHAPSGFIRKPYNMRSLEAELLKVIGIEPPLTG